MGENNIVLVWLKIDNSTNYLPLQCFDSCLAVFLRMKIDSQLQYRNVKVLYFGRRLSLALLNGGSSRLLVCDGNSWKVSTGTVISLSWKYDSLKIVKFVKFRRNMEYGYGKFDHKC